MTPCSETCPYAACATCPYQGGTASTDATPRRIQRKRAKGWRMPAGAVYVGRPSKFGNPFQAIRAECGCWDVQDENGVLYVLSLRHHKPGICNGKPVSKAFAARHAVGLFASLGVGELTPEDLASLRGHDLACWCPIDDAEGNRVPCHADVLLEVANRETTSDARAISAARTGASRGTIEAAPGGASTPLLQGPTTQTSEESEWL